MVPASSELKARFHLKHTERPSKNVEKLILNIGFLSRLNINDTLMFLARIRPADTSGPPGGTGENIAGKMTPENTQHAVTATSEVRMKIVAGLRSATTSTIVFQLFN